MAESSRPRAVVDTNLLVSAVLTKGGDADRLLRSWYEGVFILITSDALLEELETVLQRPVFQGKYGILGSEVDALVNSLREGSLKVIPRRRLPVHCRDPKDDKFLAASLGGRADYLVTGDGDLLSLRDHPHLGRLRIVTVREYLEKLGLATSQR